MVHPADKGSVVAEDTFDLRGMGKLEFLVDVALVFDRPPGRNIFVYPATVSPKLGPGFHELEKESSRMASFRIGSFVHGICELPGSHLLSHHEESLMEECLIKLYKPCEHMGLVGQVPPELRKPMPHGVL
jgi:hypothetical protein